MLQVSLWVLAAARLIRNRLDPCVSLQFAHITRHIISVIHTRTLHSVCYRSLYGVVCLLVAASHVVSPMKHSCLI